MSKRLLILIGSFLFLWFCLTIQVWFLILDQRRRAQDEGAYVYAQTVSFGFGLGNTWYNDDSFDQLSPALKRCVRAHEEQHRWDGTWSIFPWIPSVEEQEHRALRASYAEALVLYSKKEITGTEFWSLYTWRCR